MIDKSSGKKVYTIDASLLAQADCLRKINYVHNEGLHTDISQYKMDYGNAFHRFRASFRSNKNINEGRKKAVEFFLPRCAVVPENDFRTVDHLMETCLAYGEFYKNDGLTTVKIKDNLALEFSFCFPYLSTPQYDVVLCGTIDEVGMLDGRPCIVDCKVTALWKKDDFFDNFELDPQFRFYSWILKQFGLTLDYLPAMIDGIFIKKITEKVKNKVTGKLEKAVGFTGASFARSHLIEYSDKSMEEFEVWLKDKISQIIKAEETGIWNPNFNCCNDVYGACEFAKMCKGFITPDFYLRREYNPLNFQA